MIINRREFIKTTSSSALCIGLNGLPQIFDSLNEIQLTILHTNDVHSHIDPFPLNHPKNPGLGGVARRAKIIENIRKENQNVLLLDAGDSFQGTPYFNFYGGELEFKLMSKMGYDATTIGNHEFDNGIEGLAEQMPNANFDFISANYDFNNTILQGLTQPFKVFKKGSLKVGVFGLGVELQGLVDKKSYKETKYLDPIEITQEMTAILKKQQCDLIICLSHLGYDYKDPKKISDIKLAQKTKDIDIIIGGHTHTFLEKPKIVKNIDDKNVIINQVGCFGINLGRIDVYFSKDKKNKYQGTSILI